MTDNQEIMRDTIDELQKLLAEIPQIAAVTGTSSDHCLSEVICKTLRCIGDRLTDIENKLQITG